MIQTTGSYSPDDGYSFTVVPDSSPLALTLSGLTKEDIIEIASCALCLLPEEDAQALTPL